MSLPLEPSLSRSFFLRTVPTMLALTAFYLSRTPAPHRAARLSTSLAPTPLLSLPLAAAALRHFAALFCLPSLSLHPATGLPAVDVVRSRLRGLVATALALLVRQRLVTRRLLAARLALLLRPHRCTDLWR